MPFFYIHKHQWRFRLYNSPKINSATCSGVISPGYADAAIATRQPAVSAVLDSTANAVNELETTLMQLMARLSSVLRIEPEKQSEESVSRTYATPLADDLNGYVYRINSSTRVIRSLLDRLEV